MRTVIRNSYTPKLGDYCNALVVDKETGSQYLFDKDGVWTLLSLDGDEVIAEAVAQANAYTDDVAEGKVDKEAGKGLSENDFTDADKEKLDRVQENVIEVVKRNGVALPVTDKTVDVEVPTATSALTNDSGYITNEVDNLVNYYDKDATDELIAGEALTRDAADQDLQEQIDAISSASDVVDVVGTYAELQNYDTSSLSDNDIIKVLSDSTHDDATAYYRWTNNQFTYIGSEGPFYTKGEADATFVPLTRTINGKGLNSDVVLTAADVNALPASTVIPTVNDATLTIQKNGSTVTTFTANSSQNATANITVPTKTSDLTNDGEDGTSTYVEANDLAAVATSGSYNDLSDTPTIPSAMPLYTALGENTDGPITQKAAREAIYADTSRRRIKLGSKSSSDTFGQDSVSIGSAARGSDLGTVAVGNSSVANGTYSIAIGKESITGNNYGAVTIGANSGIVAGGTAKIGAVALGAWAKAGRPYEVNVGTGTQEGFDGPDDHTRVIAGVHAGILDTDAVNISQLNSAIPTNVSELANDAGYITSADLPTKTSDLTNDSGFITSSVNNLTNYYTKSQTYTQSEVNSLLSAITVPTKTSDLTNDGADGTSTYVEADQLATVATSGSYNDLSNKPTIPAAQVNSDWNAASGKAQILNKPTLATVATTGSYSDLSNKPTIPAAQIQSNWTQTSTTAVDYIKNKPTLATVATSGDYDDLSNKPTIPTVNNATLTITQNGTSVGTFTANASSNKTIAVTDTTYSNATTSTAGLMSAADKIKLNGIATGAEVNVQSDWSVTDATSDAYIKNKPTIPTVNNGTLTIQKNGTNVQTFTANQSGNATANITVPTKTSELTNDSSFVTSSGTVAKANQLTTPRTIAISGGATGTATSFSGASNISIPITDVKSAYVTWGGKDIVSNVSPDDAGCIDEFGHNKLAFLPAECIEAEYSTDGGSTWTDYGLTDAQKVALVTTTGPSVGAGKNATITAANIANMRGRIRIACGTLAKSLKIYTALKKILINFSTSGATGTKVKMRYRTIANYLSNTDTWVDLGTHDIGGWSGWNSYPYTAGNFGGNMTSQTSQPGQIEFEFWGTGYNSSYASRCYISDIRFIGATNWSTPSELARAGHLYTMDASQNATFPASVKVTGSLQHGNYTYTLPNKNGTVAMTSDIPSVPTVNNATLTIQKNGTTVKTFTANASSNVTANITVPTTVAELSDAGNYATNTALDDKQDTLTAGSHISISNDTISATGYVHSENPVTAASSTATVTGSMIANGSITANKLASGATIKLTLSTTDIGEGAALAANTLYGVYQ